MSVESFLVTALPFSADPTQSRHVSLFVTHRLTPTDGVEGVVDDFEHVRDWSDRLADATITLTANGVDVPVTPLLDVIEAGLWQRVFPPTLPVLPWQVPDRAAEAWQTFPAHRMQAHSLLTHAMSIFSSPVDAPTVEGNALATLLLRLLLGTDQAQRGLSVEQLLDHPELDDDISRRLDAAVRTGASLTSAILELAAGSPPAGLLLAADVHQARRYYERPDDPIGNPYRAQPDPDFRPTPVTQDVVDFHRRAGLLGDLSPLLRRLGLVIDLRVGDTALLVGATEIAASITVAGLTNTVPAQPRTSCVVSGTSFTAVSDTGDYARGMLRLGDGEAFTILDLDPDASALKLEQYIRNLPRFEAVENNGDAMTSSPSTLRATGFAMARNDRATHLRDRLTGAPARDAGVMAGTGAPLHLEDVARGLRLEVWDDVSHRWHSLHRRRLTTVVDGAGTVLDAAPDTGFLQGAALSKNPDVPNDPLHAHEVLAGWDGWSLSAPRPGLTVVHDAGGENLVEPPTPAPDPDHPVQSVSTVEPGTLPRLRYGRSYAFRAYAVDLAGNSSPHSVTGPPDAGEGGTVGGAPMPDAATAAQAQAVADELHAALPTDATAVPGPARAIAGGTVRALRDGVAMIRPAPAQVRALGTRAREVEVTGIAAIDQLVASRIVPTPAPVSRRVAIERVVDDVLPTVTAAVERTETQVAPAMFASALGSAAASHLGLAPDALARLVAELAHTVTPPRPHLRWDPVLEPTVVPRHAYTEAESLLTLVVRSGVEGPGSDGVTMTVVPPETYVPSVLAGHPDLLWRVDSQRHLVPPKTSQFECELHGRFDTAFGGGTDAEVKQALATSLRESGTLLDLDRADPAEPGQRMAMPGVSLVTGPTADPPEFTDPTLIPRGHGLSRGQYMIHDVDTVTVPYLADPLADGVSFVFPDAGKGTALSGLLAVEGTRLPYTGAWPDQVPWRVVLTAGDALKADAESGVVRFELPAGEQLRTKLSTSLTPQALDLLGLWRSMPAALRAVLLFADAAADGWFWWLTPATTLRFVHAVPRPLAAPRFMVLAPRRAPGATSVDLNASVDLHAASTDRLDIEATWDEWVDDLSKDGPTLVEGVQAAVGHTTIGADEPIVLLAAQDQDVPLPDGTSVHLHAAVHQLGDTKHRTIDYRLRATTRFREYFDPAVLPGLDDYSVAGPVRRGEVLSSVRPVKPAVRDVIPLLLWHQETEAEQPFALSRTRRGGVRIYLDRPWYATGNGELLAVVFGPAAAGLGDEVSQWGADPVFEQLGPDARNDPPLVDLFHAKGLDDRHEAGRPVTVRSSATLVDLPGQPTVGLLGYQPEYSHDRGMWFVDVALDPGTAFWPFVRLTVARWQPDSLPGLALSPIVKCDFAQVLPQRTALLSRPDAGQARIVITGPFGLPGFFPVTQRATPLERLEASRVMHARLEQRVPSVPTDLGWKTVVATTLPVRGLDDAMVSWEGTIDLPTPLPPQRPGDDPDWRVVVEEWEILPADRDVAPAPYAIVGVHPFRTGTRIIYADHLPL